MVKKQLSGPINGLNPLIYTGSTPNFIIEDRRPTSGDVDGYELGYWWLIPTTSSSGVNSELWVLVSKRNNVAKWKRLYLGARTGDEFLVKKQYITTPGSYVYTPTVGMKSCYVECVGGGGAGATSNAFFNNIIVGPGGGGGGYCAKFFTASEIGASQDYVVGAGGVAVDSVGS